MVDMLQPAPLAIHEQMQEDQLAGSLLVLTPPHNDRRAGNRREGRMKGEEMHAPMYHCFNASHLATTQLTNQCHTRSSQPAGFMHDVATQLLLLTCKRIAPNTRCHCTSALVR